MESNHTPEESGFTDRVPEPLAFLAHDGANNCHCAMLANGGAAGIRNLHLAVRRV